MDSHIQNPIEYGWDRLKASWSGIGSATPEEYWSKERVRTGPGTVRRIGTADLWYAIEKGVGDFGANRTDVVFLVLIYPLVGLVLAQLAFNYNILPMLFPLASGFALIGPIALIGLSEMSRRREQGLSATWVDAFNVIHSPSIGAIAQLGGLLLAIYAMWLVVANVIYELTLGPEPPLNLDAFMRDVFTTAEGWTMIIIGIGVGFLFAVAVLAISVVSFPMLLDRRVRAITAIRTSLRTVRENPRTMAIWGMIVAGALVIGMLPFFLGLILVLPVLGHATWHLYRRVVAD